MKNTNEFYNFLSIESGITDISSVKQVYNGLVRLFVKELKCHSVIDLPGVGEFELRHVGNSGQKVFKGKLVTPFKMVRYVPERNLRDQIKLW